MGLSIAISGAITAFVILILLGTLPFISEQLFSESTTNTDSFEVDDSILKTDLRLYGINATVGSPLVNFTLINEGNEKLWNYEEFDLLITYDADTGGPNPTRVTEGFSYNATAYQASMSQAIKTGDFKVQKNTGVFVDTSLTLQLTEGVDFEKCRDDCFIMLVNTRHSGIGRTSGGATQNSDFWTVYISDDSGLTSTGGTITFTRHDTVRNGGGDDDNRITWQIIESVGKEGGPDEIVVLDTGVCTFSGSLTCDGSNVSPTIPSKVAIIVTGVGNPNSGTANNDRCLVTAELINSQTPRFTRKGTAGIDCDISYAVVEFSGSNWNVHRQPHQGSSIDTTYETIPDGGDSSRMFIFDVQQRNEDNGDTEGLCQVGERVHIFSTNQLEFNGRTGHADTNWGPDMDEVVWVIYHSEVQSGEQIIVTREQPTDQDSTGGPEEETWSRPISITYNDSEVGIFGFTTHSDGCGNAFPRGSIGAMWDAANDEVDLWQSDTGQEQLYAFEVVEFPRSEKCVGGDSSIIGVNEWTIDCITYEHFEPGITNTYEEPEILAKLQYPIFANGLLKISLSTDNGVTNIRNVTVT